MIHSLCFNWHNDACYIYQYNDWDHVSNSDNCLHWQLNWCYSNMQKQKLNLKFYISVLVTSEVSDFVHLDTMLVSLFLSLTGVSALWLDNVPHGTAHVCTEWNLDTVLYTGNILGLFIHWGVALFFLSHRCGCGCSVGFWLISQTTRVNEFPVHTMYRWSTVKLRILLSFPNGMTQIVIHRDSHFDYLLTQPYKWAWIPCVHSSLGTLHLKHGLNLAL